MSEVLPHSIEAEQALLGAIMVNNQVLTRACDRLTSEHFYHDAHRVIFDAIASLASRGELANPVTLKIYLEGERSLDSAGGTAYLARLAGAGSNVFDSPHYAKVEIGRAHV